MDCSNVCGGPDRADECGVCRGSGMAPGACDCAENVLDECNVCGGHGIAATDCDCAGHVLDACEVRP